MPSAQNLPELWLHEVTHIAGDRYFLRRTAPNARKALSMRRARVEVPLDLSDFAGMESHLKPQNHDSGSVFQGDCF